MVTHGIQQLNNLNPVIVFSAISTHIIILRIKADNHLVTWWIVFNALRSKLSEFT